MFALAADCESKGAGKGGGMGRKKETQAPLKLHWPPETAKVYERVQAKLRKLVAEGKIGREALIDLNSLFPTDKGQRYTIHDVGKAIEDWAERVRKPEQAQRSKIQEAYALLDKLEAAAAYGSAELAAVRQARAELTELVQRGGRK